MSISMLLNLFIFVILLLGLYYLSAKATTLSTRVFIALGLGILFGGSLQFIYGFNTTTINGTIQWINIVGKGYMKLLQMIVMPLILVSIISAMLKVKNATSLGKIASLSIGVLLLTTAISALIGIVIASLFHLDASAIGSIVHGANETARGVYLENKQVSLQNQTLADMIISFFPENIFADLAGSRPTSTIAVVIFSSLFGFAAMQVHQKNEELGKKFESFMDVAHIVVMRLVRLVLNLTPYGILALITKVAAQSNYSDILTLINFVIASYVGLLLILIMHLVINSFVGVSPFIYLKKVLPVLSFAFTSRSSAGTLPLNIQTQIEKLGNGEAVANFSASFGATMGQNGCAGLYPAMLAVMIAPTMGINPLDFHFMLSLILIITISSFGIAGVGGGATIAAIIVLSSMGMPVALAGLLISIEPLIDMGRTAINVSGAMTAGTVTSRLLKQHDQEIYLDRKIIES